MIEAEIYITLKKTVADPQGLTVKHALESLGYKEAEQVRMGKLITIRLNLKNKEEAEGKIDEMCRKLLANPIIEDYSFNIRCLPTDLQ
ncbi:MAG: phosphoribosylformylglycinamidine synthase subunit PurS [Candidatus Omnitrophica bacterium]|nr:phosphoribosylformylglycinamidine synthase subunit PurS [Candidatus Omnitrophota bacterium]MBU0896012.1 phosphoribosylformylglycinamidine synthase subunit PurS [Candidatus Omnitrophota bacterium]MBU1133563.1 phosphoribosylformylglycinamidine synthase subunit PurS [Candidatus Omnitrophota bacterium]MBU1367260.1 phosphoribosylformylglycinamidine synthase subunit PurS [Candidatus Omnitrophota bacterium]MBU1524026.1 phosphoribosylformylglycinamidine synthase subunit PurS [Candidatus Omnitrophota